MRKPAAILSISMMALLVSTVVRAETGGRLVGSVVDENQAPLQGAVIHVTGPGAVGVYTAVSDERGRYAIPGLPTHEPLIVKARAEGKVTKIYAGIQVKEDLDLQRDFRLSPPGHHEILVLLDPDRPSHTMALEGLRATFDGRVDTLEVKGDSRKDQRRVRERILQQPNAVAAFGKDAARIARREGRQVPVVFALVPDPQGDKIVTSNACGVVLNGGAAVQLDQLVETAPEARTLVTVYDPRRMAGSVKSLRREARARHLDLIALPVRNPQNLERALGRLADRQADAFFLLFDPDFFGEPELAMIETFVQQQDMLYIAPDRSLLIADRTLAQVPGFRAMGERAGHLIQQILEGEELPMQLGVVFTEPRDVVVQRSPR